MKSILLCGVLLSVVAAPAAFAKNFLPDANKFPANSFLPPNDLHLDDHPAIMANMTETEFNKIANDIVDVYKPLAKVHGATITTVNNWKDGTVNAYATQSGKAWQINMFGGLARRSEVTADGFALVVCHELGHHFGGFSFKGSAWAANEGQSDYFATQSCARQIWKDQLEINASYRDVLGDFEKKKCDAAWSTDADQNLCYRVVAGGQSLANLLSALNNGKAPRFETPDRKVVKKTSDSHPEAQCRLDTYLVGSLCTTAFDPKIIPGKNDPKGQQSTAAEAIAYKYSCSAANQPAAARPACWFKPGIKR